VLRVVDSHLPNLELKARPIANFNMSISVGYLDAYYTSLAQGPNAGATTPEQFITLNSRLPNTPKWQPGIDLEIPRGRVQSASGIRGRDHLPLLGRSSVYGVRAASVPMR
jgi:hypothetical protein